MTARPLIRRTSGHARRPNGSRGPRRASAGLSPLRGAAGLVALLSALAIYGVGASSVFAYQRLEIEGRDTMLADRAAVESRLGLATGSSNLFLVRADRIAATLRELPTVTDAQVTVQLPDTLRIRLVERQPILAWVVGEQRFLVDREGVLFAVYPAAEPGASKDLPTVVDLRATAAGFAVGGRLDPVDLDAATRLGSLAPPDVGSGKKSLRVTVDDSNGYTVQAVPGGPLAVFGFYTPSLRTPELIPGQVRLLRSLLTGREETIRKVILASDTSGTFLPRPSSSPLSSPSPNTSPSTSP